ncbi:MAG: hypothetical protein R3332_05145 [Pseudohongiellaceae bacterium]|nr:hypothetical protein [Pseudohongiellaceae bacterium]
MKAYRVYYFISITIAAFMFGGYFAYSSYREESLKSDAFALVDSTSRKMMTLELGAMEVPDTLSPIAVPRSEMRAIMALDDFVDLDITETAMSIPLLFSPSPPLASYSILGHFVRGTFKLNVSLRYQDGQWWFTEFILSPGEMAQ